MLFYGRVPTKEKHKDEYKPIRTFAMYGIGGGGRCRQQLKIIPVLPKHVVHFLWDSCLIFSSWGDYQWGYLLALIEIMAMIAIFISLQIHSKVSHSDIGLLNKWLWGSCETSPEMKGAWMFVYSCPHCTYIIFCAATSLFYHFLRWLRVSRKDVAGLLHFVQITFPPPKNFDKWYHFFWTPKTTIYATFKMTHYPKFLNKGRILALWVIYT